MRKLLTFQVVVCLVTVLGCGDGTVNDDVIEDTGSDVTADISGDIPGDLAQDDVDRDAEDAVQDTALDTETDGQVVDAVNDGVVDDADVVELPPPDPDFVFEVRSRETCISDGPWKVDYVERFYNTFLGLPSLDIYFVTLSGDNIWIVVDDGLYRGDTTDVVDGDGVELVGDINGADVTSVAPGAAGGLVLAASGQIVVFDSEAIPTYYPGPSGNLSDVVYCDGSVYVVAGDGLYLVGASNAEVTLSEGAWEVSAVACLDGDLVVGTADGVYSGQPESLTRVWDSEGAVVTDVAAGQGIVAATDGEFLVLLDSSDWSYVALEPGIGGLPAGNIEKLAVSVDGTRIAMSHQVGVTVLNLVPGDVESLAVNRINVGETVATVDHFNSLRWLRSETVTDIALAADNSGIWAGTTAGISWIYSEPTMLADKAERMFANLNQWFWRLEGFVSAWASFESISSDVRLPLQDDDNDGQWTQEAVGAFCYAYQVTGDERYYQAARKAITNMCMQIDIPAQDFIDAGLGRGFITRSFVRDDEGSVFTSKATQSNWHLVDYMDGHQYYWKDDTSSDEMTGHFYGFSIYHDLCAKDDTERAWVAEHLTALVGYIVTHGYRLLDLDGEPTEHGKYAPEYVAVAVDGLEACTLTYDIDTCIGAWGGGGYLDGSEILAGLLAAWHVSGDQRFYDAYESLMTEHRYQEVATFNENVLTWTNPQIANYCDHELADLALLTLIRYEQRDDRRQHWIDSTMAAWEYEIGERNPLKTLALAAVMDNPPGTENGVSTLVDFPEDQRNYPYDNSHRKDTGTMGKDRFGEPQFDTVLPYDEVHSMRWDSNPYRIVQGGQPTSARSPNFWMLPYWGLRYYGVICD